ncbi:class I SAM-dependent methyltransferase [[Clostridium] fimetarium]|uniref:Methyltransferase domain-containing protein n=1 Tax=[Clostridium] fimetarium TaxID=99656 RepID=A0A1I0RTW3_9FIRM|nr:class I SAM-dependent methyltransferase [[Clostridium] fimetarium]SEW44771.1 Methyltransferase domain-containing protein [[Clostridium] fimetarium]
MAHKFDVNNKSKLDNPKRREMLPANKVLTVIGLKADDKFADIGCGIGYFSIPAAELIGQEGMVYAMDVESEMIEELNKKVDERGISNIQTIITKEYDFKLKGEPISYAFMCTVLHEIEDKVRFVNEAKRILFDGGKIAIVEWIKRESDWGPPISHRLDSGEVKQILIDCGFKEISIVELNEHFYIVMATYSI